MNEVSYHPLGDTIVKEVYNDQLTPIAAYLILGGVGSCMLESAYDEGYGKYSFIGINPLATFSAIGREITLKVGANVNQFSADPYTELNKFAKSRKAFGFVAYDAVRLKEHLPTKHSHGQLPDFLFHIYKTVLKFDHQTNKIIFNHEGSANELDLIIKQLAQPAKIKQFQSPQSIVVDTNISDDHFKQMVTQAQEYIKAGDIFQVVLSRTFTTQVNATPFDIYRALRQLNSTPYLAFFEEADYAIASASPELLLGVKNGIVETIPIAGTIKATEDPQKLLNDPKEMAEHTMLVDLARNDIGSIAKVGSVSLSQYQAVKTYSHVSHIVSRVIGQLDAKYNSLDALKALLPAGTLSGAPKIRAMEIIDELEVTSRGLYGGSIMLIDELGNLTSSIAIRTAVIYPDQVEIRTGAGIVLDSIPEKEAEETKLKARGVIAALELANGGVK